MFKITRYRIGLFLGFAALMVFPLANSFASPTGQDVDPEFQDFYDQSGGLQVFGYAVTGATEENGQFVQYFERQRFELHPENAGTPYHVLLGHLGLQDAEGRGLLDHEAFQPRSSGNGDGDFFQETGHNLDGVFQDYWHSHGLNLGDSAGSLQESLALFGFPISEEFVDPDNGLVTQYFERARFEHHPEHAGTEHEVLLGHLGSSEVESLRANDHDPEEPASIDQLDTERSNITSQGTAGTTRATDQNNPNDAAPTTSIQKLVDRAAPGSTVTVPAGIYRETVTIDKPITLQAEPGTEIRGDDENGNVVREYWIIGESDNVTIDGFTMRNASTPVQYGALTNNGYDNWTIRNCDLAGATGANVSLRHASNLHLENCDIHNAGQLGVHGTMIDQVQVLNNRIFGNNQDGHDAAWEAGGLKFAWASSTTIADNEVFDNEGQGIWCDLDCNEIMIHDNLVHHNANQGINAELSRNIAIHDNVVWENGWDYPDWGWGAGIMSQNSRDVEIYNNVVAWNADGISVISQDRENSWTPNGEARPDWNDVVNNVVHDNAIFTVATQDYHDFSLAWLEDWDGRIGEATSNNQGAQNVYYHANPDSAWMAFSSPSGSEFRFAELDEFSQTSGEENGRTLGEGEKNEILNQAGVPIRPER